MAVGDYGGGVTVAVFGDHLARIHRATRTSTHVDLSEFVAVAVVGESPTISSPGGVRYYGSETRRFVRSAGANRQTAPIQVAFMSRDDHEQVETWTGDEVLVRDGDGGIFWGTLAQVGATIPGGYERTVASVVLTVAVTDASRAVA